MMMTMSDCDGLGGSVALIPTMWRSQAVESRPGTRPSAFGIQNHELAGVNAWAVAKQRMSRYLTDQAWTEQRRERPILQHGSIGQEEMARPIMNTDVIDIVQ